MLSLKLVGVAALISAAVASDVADQGQDASPRIVKRHRHRHHHHGHERHPNGRNHNDDDGQNFFNWGPWGQTQGGGHHHPPATTVTKTVTVTACGPGGGGGLSSVHPHPSHPTSSYGPPPSSHGGPPPSSHGGPPPSSSGPPPPVSTHPHPSSAPAPHTSSAAHTTPAPSTKPGPSTKPATSTSGKPVPTGGPGTGGAVVGSNGLVNITVAPGVSDPKAWVEAHNAYRRMYHAPDVTWSDTIAAAAQRHSDTCNWGHFGDSTGPSYGQASPPTIWARNLMAGARDIVETLGGWVNGANEKGKFDPADSGKNVYSHFTQVVWADTTQIGCAVKNCPSLQNLGGYSNVNYWTCDYYPFGNVIGNFKNNVHALKGGAPS